MHPDRRSVMNGLCAAAAAGVGFSVVPLEAKAPLSGAAALGMARIKLGEIEVTALCDGYIDIDLNIFQGLEPGPMEQALAAAFRPNAAHRTVINAFVINTGNRLVLVDSGTITGFAPTAAKFHEAFRAAGFDPAAVDVIFATHLHPDHIGGIFGASGALFPNAELVVHEREAAFWQDEAMLSRAPDGFKPFFGIARNALKPYAGRTRLVRGEAEIAPGVTLKELFGHTLGHSGCRISSGKEQLLLFADVVHAPGVQFARPEVTLAFDTDQAMARETRRKLLDEVSADRLLVAGAHLDFPAFGHVARAGSGFAFTQAAFGRGF